MDPLLRFTGLVLGLAVLLALPADSLANVKLQSSLQAVDTVIPPEVDIKPVELRASLIKTDNHPVDLETVLKLVEDQNLILAQSRKNTEVFQSRFRQSQVSILPSLTGSLSENWQQGQQGVISGSNGGFISGTGGSGARRSGGSGGTQHFVQTQLGASWTLYPGGRTMYQMLAAKRRKASADYSFKETYQEQLSNAAQEYFRLLAAYQQKGVIVRSIADAREQVRMNHAKVQVGKGIPLDLSQAKTNYAQQQSNLVQAQSALLTAEQNLLNRLNLDPTIHLVPNEMDSLKRPLVPETFSVDRLIAQAVSINPSIQAGEEELKALGYDYKVVRSDLIPSITLNTSVRGSGDALNNLQRSEAIGFTLNTTLLQNMGLLVPFQMQERKKLIEQKVLAQKQLVRDVQSQVMTAFLNSENYENAIEAAQQALASAEESFQLATGRFQAGYGVYLDVLTADAQLATARNNLAQAVLNYNQVQVQLVQAVGLVNPTALIQGIQLQGNPNHANSAKNP
jgi:outer membrane protein TolC